MSEPQENVIQKDLYYNLIDNYYRPGKLTIEQLRKFNGFENVEEADAAEIVDGLYHLSVIIFKNFKRN